MNRRDRMKRGGRSGQALVELTVALVAILAVLAALLQIGLLSRAHLDTMHEARNTVAQYAIGENYQTIQPGAQSIASWSAGPDGRRYSRDDVAAPSGGADLRTFVLPVARPMELQRRVPGNRLFRLMYEDPLIDSFEFVRATAESRDVALLPVVRHLLYDADRIRLESDSVGVWLKGID